MPVKIEINLARAIKRYVEDGWTLERIADEEGVSHQTVLRKLKAAGVEMLPRTKPRPLKISAVKHVAAWERVAQGTEGTRVCRTCKREQPESEFPPVRYGMCRLCANHANKLRQRQYAAQKKGQCVMHIDPEAWAREAGILHGYEEVMTPPRLSIICGESLAEITIKSHEKRAAGKPLDPIEKSLLEATDD